MSDMVIKLLLNGKWYINNNAASPFGRYYMSDMKTKKIEKIISEIELLRRRDTGIDTCPRYIECGYKNDNSLPTPTGDWKSLSDDVRTTGLRI